MERGLCVIYSASRLDEVQIYLCPSVRQSPQRGNPPPGMPMACATAIAERHATRTPVACCRETLQRALVHRKALARPSVVLIS
uniref:hypothetical protein n=1 Tax=Scytonema sp. HK-05 TaxID=1137095 RepID=UPI001301102B